MSESHPNHRLAEFERRWHVWTDTESPVTDDRIRTTLSSRLPSRRSRRSPFVLMAAAATLVLALAGLRTLFDTTTQVGPHPTRQRTKITHRLDENVVLFISKDSEPVYIVLADVPAGKGDSS